jgi:O-antigen/teichoic acid export membrane protein
LASGTLTSYGRFALTAGVFLVLTPFVVRSLGTAEYGLWTLVFSTVGFFGVLDLGFGTAVVKFVGESRGLNSPRRRNEVLSTVLAVYCVLAVVACVALLVLSAGFSEWFSVDPGLETPALWVLWIVGIRSLVLGLPLSVFRGLLFGSERIPTVNAVQAGAVLAYGIGVWGTLSLGGGLIGLAVVNLVSMVLEHAAYAWIAYRVIPDLKLSVRLIRVSRLKEVASFSLFSLVGLLAGVILLRADPVIVSVFLSLSAVAVYGVALKVAEYGLVLTKQFVNVLTPYFARVGVQGASAELRDAFVRSSRLAVLPPAVALVSAAFLGDAALGAWVGPEFAQGGMVLTVLAASTLISAPQLVASSLLSMTGHHRFTALAAALAVVANVGVSLVLVGPLGLVGVALGTLTATVIVDAFFLVPRALRIQSLPRAAYARAVLGGIALPMTLQSAVLFSLGLGFALDSLVELAAAAGAGGAVFVATAWWTALEPGERAYVRNAVRRLRPSLRFLLPGGVKS